MDNAYPYEKIDDAERPGHPPEHYYEYVFVTDSGRGFIVVFLQRTDPDEQGLTAFELGFAEVDPEEAATGDYTSVEDSLTGRGDQFRILSTVFAVAKDFIGTYDPGMVYFWAKGEEPSRAKLYTMLAKSLAPKLGFTLIQDPERDFLREPDTYNVVTNSLLHLAIRDVTDVIGKLIDERSTAKEGSIFLLINNSVLEDDELTQEPV